MSKPKKNPRISNNDIPIPPDLNLNLNHETNGQCHPAPDDDCDGDDCCELPQVGWIVSLASGGPPMTVVDVDPENGRILANWFGDCSHVQVGEWPVECVEIVECRN